MDITPYTLAKSDQLNADDLIGRELDITISNVKQGNAEQPVVIEYAEDKARPWKPCKSMLRVLATCWSNNASTWVGKRCRLYRDPDVMYAGIKVGGIRVSHLSDIKSEQVMALTARKGAKATYKVKPMPSAEPPAELIKAGDEAAAGGAEAYKKWLDSLGDDKPLVKPYHSKWSKIATEVDNGTDDTPVL